VTVVLISAKSLRFGVYFFHRTVGSLLHAADLISVDVLDEIEVR